jgi:hypothetical protein
MPLRLIIILLLSVPYVVGTSRKSRVSPRIIIRFPLPRSISERFRESKKGRLCLLANQRKSLLTCILLQLDKILLSNLGRRVVAVSKYLSAIVKPASFVTSSTSSKSANSAEAYGIGQSQCPKGLSVIAVSGRSEIILNPLALLNNVMRISLVSVLLRDKT